MRPVVAILGMVIVLAGVAASSATAELSDIKVRVDGKAELTSNPAIVRLEAAYACPESIGIARLGGFVSQPETGALAGIDNPLVIPCTGRWETIVVTLQPDVFNPVPFTLGHALAHIGVGSVDARLLDERERSVRIVD